MNTEDDYYINKKGLLVFTKNYLKKRGFCCKNNCKHCPYQANTQKKKEKQTEKNTNLKRSVKE